jgi:hypothetical protein
VKFWFWPQSALIFTPTVTYGLSAGEQASYVRQSRQLEYPISQRRTREKTYCDWKAG